MLQCIRGRREPSALVGAVMAMIFVIVAFMAGATYASADPATSTAATASAAAPYPPTAPYPPPPPCTIAFSDPAVGSPAQTLSTVTGSGLGGSEAVTLTYYPTSSTDGARTLGSWTTDVSGAFRAPVTVPASADGSWVQAQTLSAKCTAPTNPGGGDGGGGTGTPTGSATPTAGTPSTGATNPVTSSGAPAGTTTVSSGGSSGTGGTGAVSPVAPGGGTSTGADSSSGTGSTGATSATSPSSGSTTSGSTSGLPSGSTSSGATTPSPATSRPSDALGASPIGLPISFLVTMAAVLLLLGGLAVLFLTRRSE